VTDTLLGALGVFGIALASLWGLWCVLGIISYLHDRWTGAETDWDGDER
jgi:hypothetical protein